MPETERISSREAAKILCVQMSTLANWRVLKVGPSYKKTGDGPCGRVTYDEQEVRNLKRTMKRRLTRLTTNRKAKK